MTTKTKRRFGAMLLLLRTDAQSSTSAKTDLKMTSNANAMMGVGMKATVWAASLSLRMNKRMIIANKKKSVPPEREKSENRIRRHPPHSWQEWCQRGSIAIIPARNEKPPKWLQSVKRSRLNELKNAREGAGNMKKSNVVMSLKILYGVTILKENHILKKSNSSFINISTILILPILRY